MERLDVENDIISKIGAKRRFPENNERGDPWSPCAVEAPIATQFRVARIKIDLQWSKQKDRELWKRLLDLGWQAARYRNMFLRTLWAQAMGWEVPGRDDKASASKQVRREYKQELSGDAYSNAEQSARALWSKHSKEILAGAPIPECSPRAALQITGRTDFADSGIRLVRASDWYELHLRLIAKAVSDDTWIRLPIARGTRSDEFLRPLLDKFADRQVPIKHCSLDVGKRKIIAHLTYPVEIIIPPMGARIATLGPIGSGGTLSLRTGLQTRDYTRKITLITERKDQWDLIRRRLLCTLGRGKGRARVKRQVLARYGFDDWLAAHLHTWTADIAAWCATQGIGRLNLIGMETLDWPYYRFKMLLNGKCQEVGIDVVEEDLQADSADRAISSELKRRVKQTKRRAEALRELKHQLKELA